jgi:serine/threonine protein kinase
MEPGEVGTLGPYRLIKELGHGGMGAVYAAIDTRLERQLALKVMLPKFAADAAAKERFLREARAAAKISHDHVVTVYEADERQGVPYIAMQFLKGYPLDEYLKKHPQLDIKQIMRIGFEAAFGLAAAHELGLIHRDIKPGNIWLEAPKGRVKLLDFGLAKPVHCEVELTQSGAIVGTPAYMSPEQARSAKVDHRSDIFSLGAMLYRLCTGKLPFHGENPLAILMALANDTPQPIRELNPQVPQPLADLIHQMLAKNVNDRPASATQVAERLRALARGEAPTGKIPTPGQPIVEPMPTYMPMAISVGNEANPFAGIDDDSTEPKERPAQPKEAAEKKRPKALELVGLLFAGLAVLVAGVIIIIKNKDGTETKIEVPDDASVTIKDKSGKTVAQVPPGKQPPATTSAPKAALDPDRKAAEYVLSIGGIVRVDGEIRDIRAVADLPGGPFRLTWVDCRDNPQVSDTGLAHFKDCKSVKELYLPGTKVTDAGLAHFKDCKGMKTLFLDGTQVSDAGLAHFKDCKGMTTLFLNDTQVSDAGLAHFKDCKGMTQLWLDGTQVSDAGLAHFKDCNGLMVLNLGGTQVSDTSLAHFKDCKRLTWLNLWNTQVSDAGLAHFKDCTGLTWLNLGRTQVSDTGLAHFKDCKGLTVLSLWGAQVSDAGLAHFKDCKGLTNLSLWGAQVSDAGLAHFKDCKGLTRLDVRKTKVTEKALAEFHAALPGCQIEHDGGVIRPQATSKPDR